MPILRHRMLWLLGCGITHLNQCHFAIELFIEILIDYCNPQNDAVVELATLQAMNTISYDPPSNFVSCLKQPEILISSLYGLTSQFFQEVDNKSDCLLLIQQLLTILMFSGHSIDGDVMIKTIVTPLEQIWHSSVDQYLMIRSSVRLICSIFS